MIMKKVFILFLSSAFLLSCGGANDGDATTDTTNMPVDTNVGKSTTNTINSKTGSYTTDSSRERSDSVSASSPQSRSTTPGNDSLNLRQRKRQ